MDPVNNVFSRNCTSNHVIRSTEANTTYDLKQQKTNTQQKTIQQQSPD